MDETSGEPRPDEDAASTKELILNTAKGELHIHGHRHAALDIQAICAYFDSLVGTHIAEVMMNNLEYQLGEEDGRRTRKERPQATINEIIDDLIKSDRFSGIGITRVTLPENDEDKILVEIENPCVRETVGAAKSFGLMWWCGALSALLNKRFDMEDVVYNQQTNVKRCRLVTRIRR